MFQIDNIHHATAEVRQKVEPVVDRNNHAKKIEMWTDMKAKNQAIAVRSSKFE